MSMLTYNVLLTNSDRFDVQAANAHDCIFYVINLTQAYGVQIQYIRNSHSNQIIYGADPTLPEKPFFDPANPPVYNTPTKSVTWEQLYGVAPTSMEASRFPNSPKFIYVDCDHTWKELHLFTSSETSCTKCGIKK